MNGKNTANSLITWDSGDSLSDKSLKELYDGLNELIDFFKITKCDEVARYYFMQKNMSIESALRARGIFKD